MAKSKIVLGLLVTAKELAEKLEAQEIEAKKLGDAIDALDALEDATHSTTEYKNLKVIVDEYENNTEKDEVNQKDVNNTEKNDDNSDVEKKQDDVKNNTEKDENVEKPTKKLSYAGIKMIGNKWYSIKDNYKKSFATADECAIHFNRG